MEAWRAELYHHGILGQKWGQRNGPPYPLGASKHSARERQAGWRKSLRSNSIESGNHSRVKKADNTNKKLSPPQKKTQNDKDTPVKSSQETKKQGLSDETKKNIKRAMLVAGVGTVTVGAVIAYRRIGQDYLDKTIKSGTTIQTLAADPQRINNGKHFYTTYLRGDKAAYNKLFAKTYSKKQNKVLTKYRITSTANTDAKIASNNSARKIYDKLMESNPKFRELVRESFDTSEYKDHGREVRLHNEAKQLLDNGGKKSTYVAFNRSTLLSEADNASKEAKKMFFEEMKKHGYSGLNDINDQRYSGFKNAAKQPTIIFDTDFLQKTSVGGLAFDARKIRNTTNITKVDKKLLEAGKVYAQVKGYASIYGVGAAAAVGTNYLYDRHDIKKSKSYRKAS